MKYKNFILNTGSLLGAVLTSYQIFNISKNQNEINSIKSDNYLIQQEILNNLQQIHYYNAQFIKDIDSEIIGNNYIIEESL